MLTGNYYFKQSWFGLILMVEYEHPRVLFTEKIFHWRKAKPEDLHELNLKRKE